MIADRRPHVSGVRQRCHLGAELVRRISRVEVLGETREPVDQIRSVSAGRIGYLDIKWRHDRALRPWMLSGSSEGPELGRHRLARIPNASVRTAMPSRDTIVASW